MPRREYSLALLYRLFDWRNAPVVVRPDIDPLAPGGGGAASLSRGRPPIPLNSAS